MTDSNLKCPIRLADKDSYDPVVPHAVFTELRNRDPVFWQQKNERAGFWAVLKHCDIVALSQDTDTFSSARGVFFEDLESGRGIPGSLLTSDPPRHTHLRSQIDDWFRQSTLDGMEAWMRAQARSIVDAALEKERCEFVYDLAVKLPLLAICEFMGVPEEDRAHMLELGDRVVASDDDVGLAAALQRIGDYGVELAARRADDPRGSALVRRMVSSLADVSDDPEREFAGQFSQLLVAGNETTRTLLSNIALVLCERPDIHAALRADLSGLPLALEEFLRWISPIYYMRRTATRDTELRGRRIRAGDSVVMFYVSANRDEEVFSAPEEIDIRRRPNKHLAFGVGRHTCLGARLARMEARILLEEFLPRCRGIELDGRPVRCPSNVVNGWDRIHVRLIAA